MFLDKNEAKVVKKSAWIKSILEVISEFSDLNWQYRIWVKGEKGPFFSFQESMCQLNDDVYFETILNNYAYDFNFSTEQHQALEKFKDALNSYVDEHGTFGDDAEMLNDPKWHSVVDKARAVLEAFKNYYVRNDAEFNITI